MADLRIFSCLPNPRVWKATIAARFCGVEIEVRGASGKELRNSLWDDDARPLNEDEQRALSSFANRTGRNDRCPAFQVGCVAREGKSASSSRTALCASGCSSGRETVSAIWARSLGGVQDRHLSQCESHICPGQPDLPTLSIGWSGKRRNPRKDQGNICDLCGRNRMCIVAGSQFAGRG